MAKSTRLVEPFPLTLHGKPYFILTVLKSARKSMTVDEITAFNPRDLENRRVTIVLKKFVDEGLATRNDETSAYEITPRGILMIECLHARAAGLSTPLDEPWRGIKDITRQKNLRNANRSHGRSK
jgi:predicted transcriptional regulator